MSDAIKTFKVPGKTILVFVDESPSSPREWDNFGTIVGWHRRYNIGDEKVSRDELVARMNANEFALVLWLYLNESDHSLFCRTGDAESNARADGAIFVTKERVRKEYNLKRISTKALAKAESVLRAEVEVYSQWATGDVYGFEVEETGDSCWGFFGSDCRKNGLLDHALTAEELAIVEEV